MRQAWSPVTTGTINDGSHQEGGGSGAASEDRELKIAT